MTGVQIKKVLSAVNKYIIFFILTAFVVTCCTMLFVSTLEESLGLTLTEDNISTAAKLTFGNVILVSILFTLIDFVRRKWTVDRHVKRIEEATVRMARGEFDVRIPYASKIGTDETFEKITDSINKMAKELSGVETLRNDFVSNVSHEMKTPLSVIQSYGTLLQNPDLEEKKRIEYAKTLTAASRRLSDMVTNILRLSRLENQTIYQKSEIFNLSEQLCECLLQYESDWEEKSIEIDTDIQEGIFISQDSELLYHVWNNLLSNAFKFTEAGGKISLMLRDDGETVTVKISDTGCGISSEAGEHIFEKFYQADTSHSGEGNGLGLALVKRIVDIIGGEISVESTQGAGSSFTVKIKKALNTQEIN